jgi:hypothetical protein
VRSAQAGRRTSSVEVLSISPHGLWLLVDDRELFLSFRHFPWFKGASISSVLNVQKPGPDHLYWPELDVDIAVESVDHPERFPLVSKARPGDLLERAVGARSRKRIVAPTGARRR